jgi:hypothetical protein
MGNTWTTHPHGGKRAQAGNLDVRVARLAPGTQNAAMKASLLELSAYLQTLATQLANQAAIL